MQKTLKMGRFYGFNGRLYGFDYNEFPTIKRILFYFSTIGEIFKIYPNTSKFIWKKNVYSSDFINLNWKAKSPCPQAYHEKSCL